MHFPEKSSRDLESSLLPTHFPPPPRSWSGSPSRHATRKTTDKRAILILRILFLVANVFYCMSLRGASDPIKMNHRLGRLGAYLACAALASAVQLCLPYWPAWCSAKVRLQSHITQVCALLVWAVFDHGNTLQQHGAYNLLIFALIFVPACTIFATLLTWAYLAGAWHQKAHHFVLQLVACVLISGVCVSVLVQQENEARQKGFFGLDAQDVFAQNETDAQCQWTPNKGWMQLLPFRQNFFVGSLTCAPIESFSATLDRNGSLVIDCPDSETEINAWFSERRQFRGVAYSLLPRTEAWGLGLKNDSLQSPMNWLQSKVLHAAEENTFSYTGPVEISGDTDTVVAWCGAAEPKIVYRITPASSESSTTTTTPPLSIPPKSRDALNVVTIFLDSVSRAHFHRRLPRTVRTIERLTSSETAGNEDHPQLFEYFRYHTVGLNTRPNTRALWAGLETPQGPEDLSSTIFPDSHPPLWEQFQSVGYASARIDPACQDWSAYYDPSHLLATTDSNTTSSPSHEDLLHSLPSGPRLAHEALSWSCLPPYLPEGEHFAGNFAGATSIKARCISGTHVGWHTLDWTDAFLETYNAEQRAFYVNAGFMEGHEGSGEVIATLDERLAAFLDPETSKIDYANTAVLIVSDHGPLMGLNNALFLNGKIEAANPFAALIVPSAWAGENAARAGASGSMKSQGRSSGSNDDETTDDVSMQDLTRADLLARSQTQLVSAFDLYETVRGFLPSQSERLEESGRRRGFDLAREMLPIRSCSDAGIGPETCRCT